jgi:2-polyprenyl-6-methoxyphenol hydroxylase-like FAD-dependent oxidoreductase
MMPEDRCDVAVIGAGPTGLISSLLLANLGHRVTLVEKWPEPYLLPRAVGINHETLRVLQRAKAIERLRPTIQFTPDGSRVRHMLSAEGEVLSVAHDSATSVSGWPLRATFGQPEFEGTLNELAVEHPLINVKRGWNATSVIESDDDVKVQASHYHDSHQEFIVRAQYVLGCDGAKSIVRTGDLAEVINLGFAYDWLVVDVVPHDTARVFDPHLGQILGPPRPTTMVTGGPGRRRWEFMLLDGETADDMNRADTAWRLLAPFDVTPDNATLERHAVYTFRSLWATRTTTACR